jgi:peptidoglycan/LPS O-acetylase OafA/YrhL
MLFERRPGAVRLALATLVVLHHTTTLRLGKFAVYSFFVLSGFWVFRIYRDRYAQSTHAVARFYASRWLRIFPVYLVCSLLALALFHRGELSATFVARTLSVPVHELVGSNVLPPVWSLDVELQFYFVVPLLLFVSQTRAFRDLPPSGRVALGSATVLGLWLVKATVLKFGFFFAIGIYLSEHRRRFSPAAVWASFALTILIGAWAFVFGSPGFHDTYPVEVAMTVTFIPVIADSLREAGSVRDRRIGELSYPLYLFHWMPAFYLRQRIGYYAGHDFTLRDAPAVSLAWVASFAGAYLIWLLIDLPMERLRRAWLEPSTRPVLPTELQPQLDSAAHGE